MRRHHNPRYAPEYLERKLSPSGITGIPVAAEVHIPKTQSPEIATPKTAGLHVSADAPVNPAPPNGPGDPPIDKPNTPIGPVVPA